jgi:hypothetical protein
MRSVNVRNIAVLIYLKYFLFYVYLMFKNGDYTLIKINEIKSTGDLFYYCWLFFSLPTIMSIIFVPAVLLVFKYSRSYYFFVAILGILGLEYLLYTYLASQLNPFNGLFILVISIVLGFLFFYKNIKKSFSANSLRNDS